MKLVRINELMLEIYRLTLTVLTFNSCNKCVGSPVIIYDRTPDLSTQFPGHGCMDELTTERILDILSTGIGTTMQWQTSGRLVQKLNVSTI